MERDSICKMESSVPENVPKPAHHYRLMFSDKENAPATFVSSNVFIDRNLVFEEAEAWIRKREKEDPGREYQFKACFGSRCRGVWKMRDREQTLFILAEPSIPNFGDTLVPYIMYETLIAGLKKECPTCKTPAKEVFHRFNDESEWYAKCEKEGCGEYHTCRVGQKVENNHCTDECYYYAKKLGLRRANIYDESIHKPEPKFFVMHNEPYEGGDVVTDLFSSEEKAWEAAVKIAKWRFDELHNYSVEKIFELKDEEEEDDNRPLKRSRKE